MAFLPSKALKHAGLELCRLHARGENRARAWGLMYGIGKLVINLTSPKGKKKTVKFEPAKHAALKVATTIAVTIVYRKSFVLP